MTNRQNCYTAVMLETVEQVEALPIGTVAKRVKRHDSPWGYYDYHDAAIKDGACWIDTTAGEFPDPEELIGWTAFVPCDTARQDAENSQWLKRVKADAAREALERLADEMDNLDTSAVEAENANLPADAIGMSGVIQRAKYMHEEPWEFVYEYAQYLGGHDHPEEQEPHERTGK